MLEYSNAAESLTIITDIPLSVMLKVAHVILTAISITTAAPIFLKFVQLVRFHVDILFVC